MNRCKDCYYSCPVDIGADNEMMTACVYILHTGTRRPCPAGKGCRVFRRR